MHTLVPSLILRSWHGDAVFRTPNKSKLHILHCSERQIVNHPCAFCSLPPDRILGENDKAIWFQDGFPVSPGHSLLIPKRHVASFFEATAEERVALFALLDQAHRAVQEGSAPDGFNIGVNVGAAAGQTVPHLHIHLIPRYLGDQEDPRGGVRKIFPEKAVYWDKD